MAEPGQQQHQEGGHVPEHVGSVKGTAGGVDQGWLGLQKVIRISLGLLGRHGQEVGQDGHPQAQGQGG